MQSVFTGFDFEILSTTCAETLGELATTQRLRESVLKENYII
jgi:hypothetical protein